MVLAELSAKSSFTLLIIGGYIVKNLLTVLVCLFVSLLATTAFADLVLLQSTAGFGKNAHVESFESTPTSNYENLVKDGGVILPGTTSTYAWPSGVQLTSPIPNYSNDEVPFSAEIAIMDTTKDSAAFGFGDYVGFLWPTGGQGQVPNGNKYLLQFGISSDPLQFGLSFPGSGVNAFVGKWILNGTGVINITAHGALGSTGTGTITGPFSVDNWPLAGFKFSSGELIKSVDISTTNGCNPGLDMLTFDCSSTAWKLSTSGTWSSSGTSNWSFGVPNTGYTAMFGTNTSSALTVTISGTQYASGLTFASTSKYILSALGTAKLWLSNSTSHAIVSVLSGSHGISAPLVLSSTTEFNTSAINCVLSCSGNISGAGGLWKEGPGLLFLSGSDSYTGGTKVLGGVLDIMSVNALPSGSVLSIANTAEVVFASNLGKAIQLSLLLPGA